MVVRSLGAAGPTVTPIGLGLAALGRPAYIDLGRDADLIERDVASMELRCHEVLDAAYAGGVRYVDVARSYGMAERFLADWFADRPEAVGEMTVGSKWGYTYVADWRIDADVHEVKDHSVEALRRQAPASLALLENHLSLYQIHSATLESGVLEDAAVLDELRRLRDERGVVIGMSVSGPRQADVVRRALELGEAAPFRCVQATWNVLEPSAGPALAEAHDAGWGVIVKEALANGRLTARGDPPAVRILRDVGGRHGATEDAVAIAAALAQPWADVVLSGAVTTAQLRSNLRAADVRLGEEDIDRFAAIVVPADAYWAARSALAWH
ncbi:MAG TPA: aldo/keto reductase [Actinomycetota bacterium]|nr:aldo/keto reductase [Actinomycetota bacterium]